MIISILNEDISYINEEGKVTALFSLGMGYNKELTGRENVYLNGMMLGIKRELINYYINDIQEFSGIEQFMDQPMKYYSSGMKARLGFSVAAHLDPEILILDEALNTGDAKFSKKSADKMKELVERAKMVIIVTHSLRYAQRNCDRLMWLEKGVVREVGEPKEIVANYRASVPPEPQRKRQRLELKKTEADIGEETIIHAKNLGISYKLNTGKFRSEEHTSELQSRGQLVCRLLLETKNATYVNA